MYNPAHSYLILYISILSASDFWRSRPCSPLLSFADELLEYEEKKRQAEEEKQPLPELVRAKVPFTSCLEAYGAPEQVDDFWSTALQAKSVALKWVERGRRWVHKEARMGVQENKVRFKIR